MLSDKFCDARSVIDILTSPTSYEADEELPDSDAAQFNENIRPLLDVVDQLRNLKVTSEGIPLPTIVIIGDESSGKSSVLESLAGISLPGKQGIATRVPVQLRLQSCPAAESSIHISYENTIYQIGEKDIRDVVEVMTKSLASDGQAITDSAISLHIRNPNAPDLTVIDLPELPSVPLEMSFVGQLPSVYEKIAAMIRHYAKPVDTIIVHVISGTVDAFFIESIQMLKKVEKLGETTLAVFTAPVTNTKVNKDFVPEVAYHKVTTDGVTFGLGYVCVRTPRRIHTNDDGSHEQDRQTESLQPGLQPDVSGQSLRNHTNEDRSPEQDGQIESLLPAGLPDVSRHSLFVEDKRSVEIPPGIPALAERLTTIQAKMIRSRLPVIEKDIEKALAQRQSELDGILKDFPANGEPMEMFLHVLHRTTNTLSDIMRHGNHERFTNEETMYYLARLEEKCKTLSENMHLKLNLELLIPEKTEEILKRMGNFSGLSLPNVSSQPLALLRMLVSEEIEKVSNLCTSLVTDAHSYANEFASRVMEKYTGPFPLLQKAYKQVTKEVLAISLTTCEEFVHRLLAKEKSMVFTVNQMYMTNVVNIQKHQDHYTHGTNLKLPGGCNISFKELYGKPDAYITAFKLKMNLLSYLCVVYSRLADEIALEVRYCLDDAILEKLRKGIVTAWGLQTSDWMQERDCSRQEKEVLRRRIEVLKNCKEIIRNVL